MYSVTPLELFADSNGKWDGVLSEFSVSKPYLYDDIYNQLTKEGIIVPTTFTPEDKNIMWKLAQKCFIRNEKRNPKPEDEVLLHRYYKSFLAKKYVLSRLPEKMRIHNEETGEEIRRIELIIK